MMSYEANNKGTNSLRNYAGAPRVYNSEPDHARLALELKCPERHMANQIASPRSCVKD